MRAQEFVTETAISLSPTSQKARAWIQMVYDRYPQTWQKNHVMPIGPEQFAMFELTPSLSQRDAVEVKWFQAYPLRQGVGSRAMQELQALAREHDISLTLFPWDKGQVSQAKLTKFYRGQGFSPTVKGGKAMAWSPDQPGVLEGKHPGKSVVDAIQKVLPLTQEIWFHGSRATGKHRRNSDTDILVVVPDDLVGDQYLAVVRILQKLSSIFDNYDIQPTKAGNNIHRIAQEEGQLLWSNKPGVSESAGIQPSAAGCVIVAADTGRWCLQQRSNTVSDPGVWSTWGGGRESGESVTETVLRELAEESGYTGPVTLRLVDSSPSYATFMAVVPHEFEPELNSECQDWCWSDPDQLPRPLHPGLTQTLSENFADDKVNEDSFTNNFSQIDSIITKQYPKEIMNLLLGMFPTAKEAIVYQYNDEDGMPFSEWRRAIYEIDNYILSGPVVVDGAKLPINPEIEADRLAKYQQYIKDKDSGQPARYFRANDSDPRTIDFTKLSPITIAQTDRGMEVADGNHRAFLAKMANKPLRAVVWTKQKNNHPNVAKIKSLFQEINENFADGKKPGRKGLSKRVGIPQKASLSQLQKIASSSTGERRRMAQWQLNMRRGKAKKNK